MEINEFWKLIDKAKRDPSKAAEITKALAKLLLQVLNLSLKISVVFFETVNMI